MQNLEGYRSFTVRKLKQYWTGFDLIPTLHFHQYFFIIYLTTGSILLTSFLTYPYFQSPSLSLIQWQHTTSSQGEMTKYSSTNSCICVWNRQVNQLKRSWKEHSNVISHYSSKFVVHSFIDEYSPNRHLHFDYFTVIFLPFHQICSGWIIMLKINRMYAIPNSPNVHLVPSHLSKA